MNAESQVIRDVLQMHLLQGVFQQNVRDALALKGGMGMKAIFGVERMTKDIDLEGSTEVPADYFRALIDKAIKESLRTGLILNPVVTKPKMTETTSRWKINGTTPDGSPLNLTVEMSRRSKIQKDQVQWTTINPTSAKPLSALTPSAAQDIPVLSYTGQALAFSKVQCLTSEIRTAPRDLYDLSIIIQSTVDPPIELLSQLDPTVLQRQLNELWGKLETMDWHLFQNEVIPHLPLNEQQRLTSENFETMRLQVGETVEHWLEQALSIQSKRGVKR